MRVFSLFAVITLITMLSVPAFADWTEAVSAEPAEVITLSTPPVEVVEQTSAETVAATPPEPPAPVVDTVQIPESEPILTLDCSAPMMTDIEPPPVYQPQINDAGFPVNYSATPGAIPEPSSIAALAAGLGGFAFKLRRKRK